MYDRTLLYNTGCPNRNTGCLESLQREKKAARKGGSDKV
jgi:hypothetical protein